MTAYTGVTERDPRTQMRSRLSSNTSSSWSPVYFCTLIHGNLLGPIEQGISTCECGLS